MILGFVILGHEFQYPWVLLGLLLVPLLALLYFFVLHRKRYPSVRLSNLSAFPTSSWRGKLKMYLLPSLRLLALALLIIALARPQKINKKEEIKGEGIDINLVIDLSSSMLAKDFKPNRLEASKRVAADFISKRIFDKIGLVVFSAEAHTQCPPTTDYRMLLEFLSKIRTGILNDGTAIGMGLATAVNRMKDSDTKTKVIILLTDGRNNSGNYSPMVAANMAKTLGIRIYTIGVGTLGETLAPVNKRSDGEYIFGLVSLEIDDKLLIKISNLTGGKYFRATDNTSLEKIYEDINTLEKTEYEITVTEHRSDSFFPFVFWSLVVLGIEMLLRYLFLRSLP